MEINNEKDYKLVWKIYDLLTELQSPWNERLECLDAISRYNEYNSENLSGHKYHERK